VELAAQAAVARTAYSSASAPAAWGPLLVAASASVAVAELDTRTAAAAAHTAAASAVAGTDTQLAAGDADTDMELAAAAEEQVVAAEPSASAPRVEAPRPLDADRGSRQLLGASEAARLEAEERSLAAVETVLALAPSSPPTVNTDRQEWAEGAASEH